MSASSFVPPESFPCQICWLQCHHLLLLLSLLTIYLSSRLQVSLASSLILDCSSSPLVLLDPPSVQSTFGQSIALQDLDVVLSGRIINRHHPVSLNLFFRLIRSPHSKFCRLSKSTRIECLLVKDEQVATYETYVISPCPYPSPVFFSVAFSLPLTTKGVTLPSPAQRCHP